MGIGVEVESAIDGLLNNYVTTKSAALCGMLAPVALLGTTIYLISLGFAVMRGDAQDPVHTMLWKWFRVSFVCGIALSAGAYQANIIDFLTGLQGAMTQALTGSASIGALIDNMAKPFDDLGTSLYAKATTTMIPQVSLLIAAAITSLAEVFLFAVGLGLYLLTKVAMALAFATGPAFLLCAAWPSTQKHTEAWMGQALNYVLLNVLIAASIGMLMDFASQFAQHVYDKGEIVNPIKSTIALLICAVALAVVMLNHTALAAALAGGASISGIGRMIGRYLMDKLKSSDEKNKDKNGGGSIGKDGATGAGGQGGAGGEMTNTSPSSEPLYQRHVQENIRKSA